MFPILMKGDSKEDRQTVQCSILLTHPCIVDFVLEALDTISKVPRIDSVTK